MKFLYQHQPCTGVMFYLHFELKNLRGCRIYGRIACYRRYYGLVNTATAQMLPPFQDATSTAVVVATICKVDTIETRS